MNADGSFHLDELRFVFSFLLAQRIMGTDGDVHPGEARFLDERFPPARFRELGFIDGAGEFTSRWQEAMGEALLELPAQLSVDERLALVETLWRAAQADADVHPDEQAVVGHGARLLGISSERLAAHLHRLG